MIRCTRMAVTGLIVLALSLAATAPGLAAGFRDLESQVQQFTLPNGLTFLVLERPEAPVFSFRTFVDAGGVDEVPGITGLAHMFEHMAFKGTRTVGTTNYAEEAKALDRVEAAWEAWVAERDRGFAADSTRLAQLDAAFRQAQTDASQHVVSNDFSKVLDENGAVGVNAYTSMDNTNYFYSLPSNRLELWARLEGDRLVNPVLREYYKEREVVQEERRFQESSPQGRLRSAFWLSSFLAHPYGNGLIGHPSDLKMISRRQAEEFFRKYYVAKNLTIAVVGDVRLADVKRLAEKYFSGVSDAPKPPPVRTVEPRHEAEIRVTIEDEAQPVVMIAYPIPSSFSPDWPALSLLGQVVGTGRSSRLYERLVKQDQSAVRVFAFPGFPADKYPNMLMISAQVAKGATTDSVETAVYQELDRIAADGPSAEELSKVKRMARAGFIRALRSNSGLAGMLAETQGMYGDWRKLFSYVGELEAVTAADVQRVGKEAFREGNRCVGILRKPA